jgi:hypothetical protein
MKTLTQKTRAQYLSCSTRVNTKVKQHCEQVVLMLHYCYGVNITSYDRPYCEKVVLGLDSIPSPIFGYFKGHVYKFAETTFTLNTAYCMLAQTEITLKCQSCYNVDLLRTRLNLGLNVTLLLLCQIICANVPLLILLGWWKRYLWKGHVNVVSTLPRWKTSWRRDWQAWWRGPGLDSSELWSQPSALLDRSHHPPPSSSS